MEKTISKIGFIGQGFIGKNMSDDLEERGHTVVRYALEAPYNQNQAALAACDIIFIAVPTPTTPDGFDSSILESVLELVPAGAIAVIKSTILPGTTERLQKAFPSITLLHNPEFLREKTAAADARAPERTIIGMPEATERHRAAVASVTAVLPQAAHYIECSATEAELIKYGGNNFLAMKVVFMNLLYDLAASLGADYEVVAKAIAADSRIGTSHMQVVDRSGHPGARPGRGAGGHCFPKDLAALRESYSAQLPDDTAGNAFMMALETKNLELLLQSQKDESLLEAIYGEEKLQEYR